MAETGRPLRRARDAGPRRNRPEARGTAARALDRATPCRGRRGGAGGWRAELAVPEPTRLRAFDPLPRLRPSFPVSELLGLARRASFSQGAGLPSLRTFEKRPDICPACSEADSLTACGPGVERVAEEATLLFPDARLLVLSSDTPGGLERMRAQLAAAARGDYDVIIGTQLVAKGHNFPLLTLVGVVDADVGLANGDPRAAERTFQLLRQATGRAGRGTRPGRALLQTFQPEHPVIAALLSGDVERFYATEADHAGVAACRRSGGLPP